MPQYMMVYKGDATDMSDMTEEQGQEVMAAWGAWMEKVGPALADIGAPLATGTSLVDDGTRADTVPLTGYSIVQADDLEGAAALADGHPFLSEGKGNFAIDLFELTPIPMDM